MAYRGAKLKTLSFTNDVFRKLVQHERNKGFRGNPPFNIIDMNIVYFGLASGIISYTIAEGEVFVEFRKSVLAISLFFGRLVQCFFCLSFWVSGVICIIYLPNAINQVIIIDEILTWFIISLLSVVVGLVLKWLVRLSEGL